MAVTSYGNGYTFQIIGAAAAYTAVHAAITKSATEVIDYVSRYVDWRGNLDFVAEFTAPGVFGSGNGIAAAHMSYHYDASQKWFTYASLLEGTSGADVNGLAPEGGTYITPADNGDLLAHGLPLWFGDTSEYPYRSPPLGTADFASIFLHEIVHTMGIAAGDAGDDVLFDSYVTYIGGVPHFVGPNAVAENGGQPISLDPDQMGHYSSPGRGVMYEWGNYEQNSWELGRLDLMMLKDLGWSVRNVDELALVEQHGSPTLADLSGSSDGIFDIYRFYNTQTGAHFYTASTQERDQVKTTLPQFAYEGNAFDTNATSASGAAVYRFYNNETGVHFYTISEAERDSVINNLPQFQFEGEAYRAYTSDAAAYCVIRWHLSDLNRLPSSRQMM